MKPPLKRKTLLVTKLLRWYKRQGRELPWRNERDPYRILISEVMLQQTQVSRVRTKYRRFLKQFPSLRKLAKASPSDVIKAWEGMGYNNRALRLRRLAVDVLEGHSGRLPESIPELESLPGIGRYTAHALACFAFGQHVPVVDTNIKRVLTRLYPSRRAPHPRGDTDIWHLAESLLPYRRSQDWNQALMDLGATICTAAKPKCNHCPLAEQCPSAHRVPRNNPRSTNSEPGRGGIPNRIYRGRAVQALRKLTTHEGMDFPALARIIKPDYNLTDKEWFRSLLRSLQKNGLIQIRTGDKISLPE